MGWLSSRNEVLKVSEHWLERSSLLWLMVVMLREEGEQKELRKDESSGWKQKLQAGSDTHGAQDLKSKRRKFNKRINYLNC